MKRIFFLLIMMMGLVVVNADEPRNALLIANGNYKNFSGLKNPIPEANALAKSLKQLGFKVTVKTDLSLEEMQLSLVAFEGKIKTAGGIAFFHYGGHAVQVNGENYLIPVDADIPDEQRVRTRSLNLDEVMTGMRGDTNIVILDACRNNPLPAGSGRSATRGLVPVKIKPRNSIIVYSAEADSVAQDGVFTPILTQKILESKSFTSIIMDVRKEVKAKTKDSQKPGAYLELDNEIFLAEKSSEEKPIEQPKAPPSKTAEKYYQLGLKAYNTEKYEEAVKYYQKAADLGHIEAQYSLGECYYRGKGFPHPKWSEALEWFLKAANQGHAKAQYSCGFLYYLGCRGVPQSNEKALEWYQKAADQGIPEAFWYLGLCYDNGEGVSQNYAKAVECYQKAAELGYIGGLVALGECYEMGKGVPQSYAKAVEWYQKAADQGDEDAKKKVKELSSK